MAIYIKGNVVSNAESYTLHKKVGSTFDTNPLVTNTQEINFNLSDLFRSGVIGVGTHTFAVRAHALDYESSDFSNEVSYTFGTPVDPTTYTFTINPTPTSATVTLSANGYSTVSGTGSKSITVANGTVVNWSVSASGYARQNGTWTINGDNKTLPIDLVKNGNPGTPEEPTSTTWYIDNAEQTGKAFNYGSSFPGAAARIDSVASAIRGVPINAVKFYPSAAGTMLFARWVPGNMPTFAASIEVPVEDVYTTAPANNAGAKTYMLSETVTLAANELLLCKWNDPATSEDTAGFWVNAGGGGNYAVSVWKTGDNTAGDEPWGLPFSIGYVK